MDNRDLLMKQKLKYFLIGVGCISALFLMGSSTDYGSSSLNFGRYQLSSWSTQLGGKSGAVGAFVMDTVSGETKTVYIRTYGDAGKGTVVKNDLKKSFSSIE